MVTRVKIGSNVIAGRFPTKNKLQGDHPLGGDALPVEPHGNLRLPDALTGVVCQLFGNSRLPARLVDRLFNRSDAHMSADYNTVSVIEVNTRSAKRLGQTRSMPKAAQTSEFWRRLTEARTSCVPPLSMRQEDVAKDAGMSFQSAVTKWKTGKGEPSFEVYKDLAIQAGVTVDWLITGRGEMRPRPTPDLITTQIIQALDALPPPAKLEILKEAFTQQTLQHPAIAAQLRAATKAAEKLVQGTPSKTG